MAASGVTHRDLFFESLVKLPFLNVDLSIPARIVLDRNGVVVYTEADPDYTYRPEVEPMFDVLRNL